MTVRGYLTVVDVEPIEVLQQLRADTEMVADEPELLSKEDEETKPLTNGDHKEVVQPMEVA